MPQKKHKPEGELSRSCARSMFLLSQGRSVGEAGSLDWRAAAAPAPDKPRQQCVAHVWALRDAGPWGTLSLTMMRIASCPFPSSHSLHGCLGSVLAIFLARPAASARPRWKASHIPLQLPDLTIGHRRPP